MGYIPFTPDVARETLSKYLSKIEKGNNPEDLNKCAAILANFQAAGTLPVEDYLVGLPVLGAEVESKLPLAQAKIAKGRSGNLAAMLAAENVRNGSDSLFFVATSLLKLVGGI